MASIMPKATPKLNNFLLSFHHINPKNTTAPIVGCRANTAAPTARPINKGDLLAKNNNRDIDNHITPTTWA
ncbi:MAG: hypothetical protein A2784_01395 [Candidatus Chisholmbacteria bacterium RIFCSPHIGHO2_01_FULL_48_12]|uniref:Uncharacterized protein n=1 Tax=Candidatus Chisholmbacteria bacterium RIFCSPHIGHO2_01_FULL_48_12 TaxID=1797589 RepID=A0A1G1VQ81_9BACT|nr:MAG: hypothetical protein A2784_01395 [Candidatus Chisholmbacteria bacterium RIFCSPHIGHO2_01_FULL_48_12]